MHEKEDKLTILGGLATVIANLAVWLWAGFGAPIDANQGPVYKIIFIHVPVAASSLAVCGGGLFIFSIVGLIKTEERFLRAQKAWVEVGLLYTILTLATGSIWGKPTWGTWWTWDARLTTTFLFAVLMIAFLLLHNALSFGKQRIRICSVLGIIIFVNVPMIYKSVEWWRTLHQPASLIASRGRTMDPEMLNYLLISLAFTAVTTVFFWWMRKRNLDMADEIEQASLQELRG